MWQLFISQLYFQYIFTFKIQFKQNFLVSIQVLCGVNIFYYFFPILSHTGLFAYAFATFIILNSYLAELNLRGMNQEELPPENIFCCWDPEGSITLKLCGWQRYSI